MCNLFDLNQKVTWSAWQFGVLKMCAATLGIIFGAYFASFFSHYYVPLWIIAAVTWSFSVAYWFKAQEPKSGKSNKSKK